MTLSSTSPPAIQWRRLSGIVAIQSALTLAWVIYAMYLPDLLEQLGFDKAMAGGLLILEHALEVVVEPIFGGLSDRSQHAIGSRLPIISFGVVLTSAFFIALPAIATFVPPATILRWLLPIVAVLWASAMAMFRSPALSLLREASPQLELPLAASALTLVQQLVGALRFTAYGFILSLGPLVTFAIGSIAFLAAGGLLQRMTPPTPKESPTTVLPRLSVGTVVAIAGTAIGIGFGIRFLFADLAQLFSLQFGKEQISSGMLSFNLWMALCAIPAGKLATKVGNIKAMFAALVAVAVFLGASSVAALSGSTLGLLLALIPLGFMFSAVLNSMVPLVLELVPAERSGLGVGSYFGAFGGAISLFGLIASQLTTVAQQASCGVVAFVMAGLFVLLGRRNKHSSPAV